MGFSRDFKLGVKGETLRSGHMLLKRVAYSCLYIVLYNTVKDYIKLYIKVYHAACNQFPNIKHSHFFFKNVIYSYIIVFLE